MGMVGQNGQVFVRTEKQNGHLLVRWGDDRHEQCSIFYQIDENELTKPLISKYGTCMVGE